MGVQVFVRFCEDSTRVRTKYHACIPDTQDEGRCPTIAFYPTILQLARQFPARRCKGAVCRTRLIMTGASVSCGEYTEKPRRTSGLSGSLLAPPRRLVLRRKRGGRAFRRRAAGVIPQPVRPPPRAAFRNSQADMSHSAAKNPVNSLESTEQLSATSGHDRPSQPSSQT